MPSQEVVKAVVYSRVSTEEQNPKSQLQVVLDYCSRRGYEILRIFEENISGSVNPFERPGFREMLEFIKSSPVDVIVMHDITRFYRPPPNQVHQALSLLNKLMNEYSVLVEFVSEPQIEDPMLSELWRFLKSWIAGYERLQIQLRTKYGLLRRKREGKYVGKPSLVAYYAAWIFNKEIKDLTVNEVELAKKQLLGIIMKYWSNPAVKKKMVPELLARNELAGLYQRFPQAPRSYLTILRIVKRQG